MHCPSCSFARRTKHQNTGQQRIHEGKRRDDAPVGSEAPHQSWTVERANATRLRGRGCSAAKHSRKRLFWATEANTGKHTQRRVGGQLRGHFWKERKDKRIRTDKGPSTTTNDDASERTTCQRRRSNAVYLYSLFEVIAILGVSGNPRFVYVAIRRFTKPGFSSYSPSNSPLLSRSDRSNVNRSSSADAQHHTRLRLASTRTPFVHFWHQRRSRRNSHSLTHCLLLPPRLGHPRNRPNVDLTLPPPHQQPPVSTLRPTPLSSTQLRKLHPYSFPPTPLLGRRRGRATTTTKHHHGPFSRARLRFVA